MPMLPADPPPRLAPLGDDELTPEMKAMFERWKTGPFKGADTNPVLRTFIHNPVVADLFSTLNIHVLVTSTVPVRQRQIAIMRTAWLTKATYMWSSHLNTSQSFGLETGLFEPIKHGADDPYFSDFEKTVIRATEDLVERHEIGEDNWNRLMAEWTPAQMMDFLFTVGAYVTVAGVMRSCGVQRQDDLLALAERFGAP
ncbi:MAG: hypothetical protein KGM17_08940 [Sphingomonadales bacterium]|nr:hypothetical protein [Sphingomonadales bacterium]